MDHEAVADRLHRLADRVLQHSGAVDRHVTLRVAQHPKIAGGSAAMVRDLDALGLVWFSCHLCILPPGRYLARRPRLAPTQPRRVAVHLPGSGTPLSA
jgi:hypothetical protein